MASDNQTLKALDETELKKQEVLKELKNSFGIISRACDKADICRDTFYRWLKEDKHFAKQWEHAKERAKDFVESKLYQSIEKGDPSSLIFYCRTKMRDRGYDEKQTIKHDGSIDVINVNFKKKNA